MVIRTFLIDDDTRARQRLRTLLSRESDIAVLGEYMGGAQASAAIRQHRPDLIFLNVQATRSNGLEILDALPASNRPLAVVVSQQDQHTLRAFELGALDYLLKPIKPARLRQTIARVRDRLREPATVTGTKTPVLANFKRILVRQNDHLFVVPTSQIDWMESANNYIVLHVGRDSHVLRQALSQLERRLSPVHFLRVSRFAIVNLDRVRELKLTPTGEHSVVMADGAEVPLTRGIRDIQQQLEFA
jgi:two-component system LytT family response regulator